VSLYRTGTRRARLYGIAVADAARGQGVATALVEAVATAARTQGCTALGLEVRADNDAAQGLYRKLGFVAAGVLPDYYEDGTAARRMRRALTGALQPS
jgi:ribosomal protein S18 acetylase RimI-like enzyme